jgi:hypothetical protein
MHADDFFEKCPFKKNGKLSKLFQLVPWGLNLPAESDTPQNKILQGIRPRRTRSCWVSGPPELSLAGYLSDPAEQWQSCVHFIADTCYARSDTRQNNIVWGLIPRLTKFCGVSYPAEHSPAGYRTPQNNI